MPELARVLEAGEQREVLLPIHIPPLEHRGVIHYPDPGWTHPTEEQMRGDDGSVCIKNAPYHPEISKQRNELQARMLALVEKVTGQQGKDRFAVYLASDEAFPNALKHGHRTDPNRVLEVGYGIVDSQFVMHFTDEGEGFDVDQYFRTNCTDDAHLENPGGRGIPLIRSFMCQVLWNKQGNEMVAWRTLEEMR